jgi:chromosome segregation ATPase
VISVYAGLERAVLENVRLVKKNEDLQRRLTLLESDTSAAHVKMSSAISELESDAHESRRARTDAERERDTAREQIQTMRRDQESSYDAIMSRLGVIIGQNECLKQKNEEVLKHNGLLQHQIKVLQKQHENLHRQYDNLKSASEHVQKEVNTVRQQNSHLYKRLEKMTEEVLDPLVERVGNVDGQLATLGEQVLMVREEGVATRELLQELRQRLQDIFELQEETEKVMR